MVSMLYVDLRIYYEIIIFDDEHIILILLYWDCGQFQFMYIAVHAS